MSVDIDLYAYDYKQLVSKIVEHLKLGGTKKDLDLIQNILERFGYITKDNDADSEEDYITCGDQGFGNCANCGGTIVWSGDFMRSDFYDDPSDDGMHLHEDDDAIVRSLTCGHWGCGIYVWEPSQNEMKSGKYPYWEEYFKEKEENESD